MTVVLLSVYVVGQREWCGRGRICRFSA